MPVDTTVPSALTTERVARFEPSNALLPMLFTLKGNVTEVTLLPLKASSSMAVTLYVMPLSVNVAGIVTEPV